MLLDEEADMKALQDTCAALRIRFDTIQIVGTRIKVESESEEQNGTVHVTWGHGNWFARYGSVKAWIIQQEQDIFNENKGT